MTPPEVEVAQAHEGQAEVERRDLVGVECDRDDRTASGGFVAAVVPRGAICSLPLPMRLKTRIAP